MQKMTFKATATEAVTSLTVTPTFGECEAFKLKAAIHMNGCTYTFTPGEHTVGKNIWHGTMDIVCPKEKEITITSPEGGNVCVVHIPPQNNLGSVTYTNLAASPPETPEHYLTIDADLKNFHFTETEINKLLCPGTDKFTGTEGTFTTKIILKGYEDLGTHEVEGKLVHTEGAPVGIDVGTQDT